VRAKVSLLVERELDDAPELVASWRALMTPEEQAAEDRFVFPLDRRRHRAARALVRTTLAKVTGLDARAIRFELGEKGRPELHPSHGMPRVRFNLSHTKGLLVLAVTDDRGVGIDVEDVSRRGQTVEIADRFFAPAEVRDLRALPLTEQRDRFFHYWTLKESYIKGRGLGLALPLDSFAFSLAPDRAPVLACDERCADDPRRWVFRVYDAAPSYRIAIALERREGDTADPEITFVHALPGVFERAATFPRAM
jgi:4'-phosphopantetheinyl transferase